MLYSLEHIENTFLIIYSYKCMLKKNINQMVLWNLDFAHAFSGHSVSLLVKSKNAFELSNCR